MDRSRINHYYSRILQEIALRTGASFGKPTEVRVLLTNRCNAHCIHCQSWKLHDGRHELSTGEWEDVLGQLRSWLGPIFITITGGETLLRSDAVHLAGVASRLGFRTELLTNGYLMSADSASSLVRSGVKRVTISFDGSTPEIHDAVRGRKGFFEKAQNAFRMLAEEKSRTGGDTFILAKTTIMSLNVDDLSNIARLARGLGIDGVLYQAIEPAYYSEQLTDRRWYVNNPLWVTDLQRISRAAGELKSMKSEGYPIANAVENLDLIYAYFQNPEGSAHRVHTHEYAKKKPECRSWVAGLQIMPDGGLKMCHFMEPFGRTRDGRIRSLWNHRGQCWKEECPYRAFL